MGMPAAKGLFHRAIVQSGPFLKSLSPDYSGRVAELVLAELGLSKSQGRELQKVPVDHLSGAAAEAMKKMPQQKALPIRQEFGEHDWGPTVDGRILPRHRRHLDGPLPVGRGAAIRLDEPPRAARYLHGHRGPGGQDVVAEAVER